MTKLKQPTSLEGVKLEFERRFVKKNPRHPSGDYSRTLIFKKFGTRAVHRMWNFISQQISNAEERGRMSYFKEIMEAIKNPTPQYVTEKELKELLKSTI